MNQIIDSIYLDMDGVITDFVKGAARVFGKSKEELLESWKKGVWEPENAAGVNHFDFWDAIERSGHFTTRPPRGISFWRTLEKLETADSLWAFCVDMAHTHILSAPGPFAGSLLGKMEWLREWKGKHFDDFTFSSKKYRLASPSSILIDDTDAQIDRWRLHGGVGIVYPQYWNSNHKYADSALPYTIEQLLKNNFNSASEKQ